MTVTRTERDLAIDRVAPEFLAKLSEWVSNERDNLQDFVRNPQEHVMFSPFMIVDFDALRDRIGILGAVADNIDGVVAFKMGDPNTTRGTHDQCLDAIPHVAYDRLVEWLARNLQNMTENMDMPLSDYNSMVSFNVDMFMQEIAKYKDALEAVPIVREYALGQLLENQPTEEQRAAVMSLTQL